MHPCFCSHWNLWTFISCPDFFFESWDWEEQEINLCYSTFLVLSTRWPVFHFKGLPTPRVTSHTDSRTQGVWKYTYLYCFLAFHSLKFFVFSLASFISHDLWNDLPVRTLLFFKITKRESQRVDIPITKIR